MIIYNTRGLVQYLNTVPSLNTRTYKHENGVNQHVIEYEEQEMIRKDLGAVSGWRRYY